MLDTERALSPLPLSFLWMLLFMVPQPLAYLPQEPLRLEPQASPLEVMVLCLSHS